MSWIKYSGYTYSGINDSLADFGDYSAKLLSFDKVAVVRLYIGGCCIKCIKFGSGGPYRFENYYLYAESLSADKIEGRLGEISTIQKLSS